MRGEDDFKLYRRLRCASCGGELYGADLEFIEDNKFYIVMLCEDCHTYNSIEAEPVKVVAGEDEVEIEIWR